MKGRGLTPTRLGVLIGAILCTPLIHAQQCDPAATTPATEVATVVEEASHWSGSAALGLQWLSGNSNSKAGDFSLSLSGDYGRWKHDGEIELYYESSEGETVAQQSLFDWRSGFNYGADKNSRVFLDFELESDRFGGYRARTNTVLGWEKRFELSDDLTWTFDIGPGFTHSLIQGGGSETAFLVGAGTGLEYKLTDNLTLSQRIDVDASQLGVVTRSVTEASVALGKGFSLKLGFDARHNSDPPAGVDSSLDTRTTIGVGFDF